jgi:hypothetical protein
LASKYVKQINGGYRSRYTKKVAKGHGIYAYGLPGTRNGIHATASKDGCQCGRCSA